jgi:hypothetical protein
MGRPSLPYYRYVGAVLAENPIRPKMGLDWTCTMLTYHGF